MEMTRPVSPLSPTSQLATLADAPSPPRSEPTAAAAGALRFSNDEMAPVEEEALTDVPPPAYSPQPESPRRKTLDVKNAPLDAKTAPHRVPQAGPSRAPMRANRPEASWSLAGYLPSSVLALGKSAQSAHLELIVEQIKTLLRQSDVAAERHDTELVRAISDSIDATCEKYQINRWSLMDEQELRAQMDDGARMARRLLLRGDDEACAHQVSLLASMFSALGTPFTPRSAAKRSSANTSADFTAVSGLIESGETPLRLALTKDMTQTLRAFFNTGSTTFMHAARRLLQKELVDRLRKEDGAGAIACKNRLFALIRAARTWQEGKVGADNFVALLSADLGFHPWDNESALTRLFGDLLTDSTRLEHWSSYLGHRGPEYRFSKLIMAYPQWPSLVVALGFKAGSLRVSTDASSTSVFGHQSRSMIAQAHSSSPAQDLTSLALSNDCEELLEIVYPNDWSGKERPGEGAVRSLGQSIVAPSTRHRAIEFLRAYQKRSEVGGVGLTSLICDEAVAAYLPADLIAWIEE